MSRSKTLLSNTLVFAISNFTSKFLGLLMLPFYTSILSKEEFGTADLISTTIGLLIPVFTLSIADATLRYAMDKSSDSKQVFSFGLKVLLIGFSLLILLFPIVHQIKFLSGFYFLFYLLYLTSILQTFFSLFSRGINKIKLIGIAGVTSSIVIVISNVVLMYFFNMGVQGYLLSMIISYFIASTILFFGGKMYQFITLKRTNKLLLKEMLSYSSPLIPNALSWWINHTSNRYIIKYFCSVAEVGLFSAAARMPSILIGFQGIFIQAWQISAISEYDKKDNLPFFSNVFKTYNTLMILSSSLLIILSKYIAKVLYAKSFYDAWIYTPFLLISVVFGSIVGFYSSFYLAHKKTNVLFLSTFIGALVTIVFNLIMVPIIGPLGSSIANALAYFCVWLFLHIDSRKFLKLEVKYLTIYIQYIILFLQASLMVFSSGRLMFSGSILCLLILIILNYKEIKFIIRHIGSLVKKIATSVGH
jgi:O-antigen/teichoic acid export membrane protein